MEQIKTLQQKIESLELNKSDLDNFISILFGPLDELEGPSKTILEDFIHWFKAISYLLGKYESGNYGITGSEWKEENIEFEKLRTIIDEMDYAGILAYKSWTLGGNCNFRVVDKAEYLQFLYSQINVLLSKILTVLEKTGIKIPEDKKARKKEKPTKYEKKDESPRKVEEEEKEGEDKYHLYQEKKLREGRDREVFNTNLKPIEEELEYTVKKLYKFGKTQKEIEKWVSQFRTDKERIYALKLLNNMRYYDDEGIIEFHTLAHKNLLREFDNNPNINHFLFVPAGGPASSAGRCTPDYRMYNDLKESQIISSTDLNNIEDRKYKYIVFIDDFVGTGNQACDFFSGIDFANLKSKKIERFFFVVWMAFEDGINFINKAHEDIELIFAELLTEKDKAFSEESKVFSEEEKEEAKAIFEKYGKSLYKDNPLGYADFSALISFKTKSPNHTLPVIWSDARGWFPIFRRFYSQ